MTKLVLFKQELRKVVREEITRQELPVHVSLVVINGSFMTVVEILDEEGQEVQQVMSCDMVSALGSDLLAAYRQYRITVELPELSDENVINAAIIPVTVVDLGEQREAAFEVVSGQLGGKEKVDAILAEIPPGLDDLVERLLDADVVVSINPLVAAVDAGQLTVTPFLQSIGVDSKVAIEEETATFKVRAETHIRAFQEFLRQTGHSRHTGCGCEEVMVEMAVHAYRKGLEMETDVVGVAILRYFDAKIYQLRQIQDAADSVVKRLYGSGAVGLVLGFPRVPSERAIVRIVAEFLAGRYGGEVETHAARLSELKGNWLKLRRRAQPAPSQPASETATPVTETANA